MFTNSDYSCSRDLQAARATTRRRHPRQPRHQARAHGAVPVRLQAGDHDDLGLDVTRLLQGHPRPARRGVRRRPTTAPQYARLDERRLRQRASASRSRSTSARWDRSRMTLDYTWQHAHGNSSDPHETATRAAAGRGPAPAADPVQLGPAPHAQPHRERGAARTALRQRHRCASRAGSPTRRRSTPASARLEANSGRKPSAYLRRPARASSPCSVVGRRAQRCSARVFNLFDSRFFNGFVFADTGSPYYSRFTDAGPEARSPTRRATTRPRRIEVGLALGRRSAA